jgi:hypothetical protein
MMIPKYFILVSGRNLFIALLPFANDRMPLGYAAISHFLPTIFEPSTPCAD